MAKIEIHTPEPSPPKVEIAIAKLKKYKSPGSDQIPAELIQAGGEALQSEIHKLINSIWIKEELPDQWKEGDKTDCSNYRGSLQAFILLYNNNCYTTTVFTRI
jgi:hypothetical protein